MEKKIIISLAPKSSIVPVEKETKFYPVREEHQNYYKKKLISMNITDLCAEEIVFGTIK